MPKWKKIATAIAEHHVFCGIITFAVIFGVSAGYLFFTDDGESAAVFGGLSVLLLALSFSV
jgi:hypothetical protein